MFTLEVLIHLTQLFKETGQAHHEAFLSTNGADENWPTWYASYLQGPLNVLFGVMIEKETLKDLLIEFDKKHTMNITNTLSSHTQWADYYARLFLEHYGLLKPGK